MQEQNLFFNILTFDWQKQPVSFIFMKKNLISFHVFTGHYSRSK